MFNIRISNSFHIDIQECLKTIALWNLREFLILGALKNQLSIAQNSPQEAKKLAQRAILTVTLFFRNNILNGDKIKIVEFVAHIGFRLAHESHIWTQAYGKMLKN